MYHNKTKHVSKYLHNVIKDESKIVTENLLQRKHSMFKAKIYPSPEYLTPTSWVLLMTFKMSASN